MLTGLRQPAASGGLGQVPGVRPRCGQRGGMKAGARAAAGMRAAPRTSRKSYSPLQGTSCKYRGGDGRQARPKSTEADLPEFGRTGSKTTISRSRRNSAGLQCKPAAPALHYCGSRHSPTKNLKLLNTVSHQPRGAGFTKSRESATAANAGPAKCKR